MPHDIHYTINTMESDQSVWMARWMRTDILIASHVSGSLEIMKQTVRGGSLKNQRLSSQSLPVNGMQELTPLVDAVAQIHQGKLRTTSCCLPKSAAVATTCKSPDSMEMMKPHAFFSDQFPNGDIKQSETEPYHSPNTLATSSINRSSGDHLPLQNFPGFRQLQFSRHGTSPELTKLEKFHDGYSSMRKLPPLVPKGETLRISANMWGSSGCFPKFSPNTKSTDVRFGKEGVIKNVGVSSNIDINEYLSSSSPFARHARHQGVKIQSLGSSTDTEGNKYHEDSKDSQGNLKNASSAETDAMDMDAFTEGCQTSGVNQSSFNKASNSKTMLLSGDQCGSDTGNTYRNSKLPDINLELSAANNTTEGAVPGSSKTQSLDMDMLLVYPARTNNSISGPCLNMLPKTDPTGRWAKRLKSSASHTQGFGTQSFDLEDVSRNKMKRTSGMFTSELLEGNHKEKLTEADKTKAFQINDAISSKVGSKRGKDLLVSQSWIQRWLRNQVGTPEKQSEALVLCEPQSSKLVLDDLQKKQFPSIAAMALMGKAINGFQPCELQDRGTFVVWN